MYPQVHQDIMGGRCLRPLTWPDRDLSTRAPAAVCRSTTLRTNPTLAFVLIRAEQSYSGRAAVGVMEKTAATPQNRPCRPTTALRRGSSFRRVRRHPPSERVDHRRGRV